MNTTVGTLAAHTQLKEWGTSRGIRIPRPFCDLVGIAVGSDLDMRAGADEEGTYIVVRPARGEHRSFPDAPYLSMDSLFEGWEGAYAPPADWPTRGSEIDWGEDVGAEVVQ